MKEFFASDTFKHIAISLGALLIAFIISKILRLLLSKFLNKSFKHLKVDHTQFNFLKNAVSFLVFLAAIIYIFSQIEALEKLSLGLFAGAGIVSAVLLFASQQAFANIISGVFIVIFKPFRVNDLVDIGSLPKGRVEDITLRHTVIRNFENRRMIIPNSVINSEIIVNSSIVEEEICNFMDIGISYDSDINLATMIIQETAAAHPNCIDKRSDEEKLKGDHQVRVRVMGYGDSSVNLRAYIWSNNHSEGFVMKTDLYKSIKEEFDKQGIEIPFPYRTLVFKNNKE